MNWVQDFLTGSSYTETISVCTGGSYTIVVSDDGSYPSEIGLNVVSGGATIATYTNSFFDNSGNTNGVRSRRAVIPFVQILKI